MKVGLILGKYAPFHKGHQLVADRALSEMDKVICLIYETDVIDTPLQVIANWIRTLYPEIKVIECWDGPDGYGLDEETIRTQNTYILKVLNGTRITHFYSSEPYGESVSQWLGAVNVQVDEMRQLVPVSATMIRSNPYAYREFLSPIVYNDMVIRIVFMGAMSTGKSTLTERLAKEFNTAFMPEYGREYWEKHQIDRRISPDGFNEIAVEHIRRENELVNNSNKYLFVDTNPITTYVFCKDYHNYSPELLTSLAKHAETTYDLYFLCEDDIPYDDTWDRSGEQKREWFHRMIIADLKERKIPFIRLKGTLNERVEKVKGVLKRYSKYSNIIDIL